MKPLSFRIESNHMVYEGTLYHKYNSLIGDSATGKSMLLKDINIPTTECYGLRVSVFNIDAFKAGIYSNHDEFDLLLIDEYDTYLIESDSKLIRRLEQVQCFVIIINREKFCKIPMNYKSMYRWDHVSKHKNVLTRVFKDYDVLNTNRRLFVCEDSKSGFAYFARYLPDVISSNGVANLIDFCQNRHIIADGAAIGPYLRKILEVTEDVFLPESFEYLCYKALVPNSTLTVNYLEKMPLTCLSTERFFTKLLTRELLRMHVQYDKSECPRNILLKELVPGLTTLSEWGRYCEDNNISDTLAEMTRLFRVYGVDSLPDLMKLLGKKSVIQQYFDKYNIPESDQDAEIKRLMSAYDVGNLEELEEEIKLDFL